MAQSLVKPTTVRSGLRSAAGFLAAVAVCAAGISPAVAAAAPSPVTNVAVSSASSMAGTSARTISAKVTVKPAATTVATSTRALIGMSAPAKLWDQRVREIGPGLEARRLFFNLGDTLTLAQTAVNNGLYPIMSFKIPGNDWAGVAAGKYDAQLATLKQRLVALNARGFVTLHHEPAGDGTAANWAAMLTYALPKLNTPLIDVGVIGNGWWWSSKAQGYTDAEIAAYITPSVRKVAEIIAADTYQGGTPTAPGEGGSVKMANMLKWAQRTGVPAIGIGEFNAYTATEITAAMKVLGSSPTFKFGSIWNSECSGCIAVEPLSGDRLIAFKTALATWR